MLVSHAERFSGCVSGLRFDFTVTLSARGHKDASKVAVLLGKSEVVGFEGGFLGGCQFWFHDVLIGVRLYSEIATSSGVVEGGIEAHEAAPLNDQAAGLGVAFAQVVGDFEVAVRVHRGGLVEGEFIREQAFNGGFSDIALFRIADGVEHELLFKGLRWITEPQFPVGLFLGIKEQHLIFPFFSKKTVDVLFEKKESNLSFSIHKIGSVEDGLSREISADADLAKARDRLESKVFHFDSEGVTKPAFLDAIGFSFVLGKFRQWRFARAVHKGDQCSRFNLVNVLVFHGTSILLQT